MGGLGGHMAHLSEDLDLTFNEIVDVLGKVARAEIKNVTEKVDGQNLFLSVDAQGNIRTARNATDIKKGGMTPTEYAAKWEGHPAGSAFTNGFKAVTAALKRLDAQTLQQLFSGGERYINIEIMYPKNPNIINYTAPQIVLHGLKYVGSLEDKEEQKRQEKLADDAFEELSSLVDATEAQVGEELWRINGPKLVDLQNLADNTALEEVTAKIEEIADPVGMSATLGDLVEVRLRNIATNEGLPADIIDEMIFLVLDRDAATKAGVTTSSLKKQLPKELKPVISRLATKTTSRKVIASILYKLEVAISDFAIEALRGIKSFFVDEHDQEVVRQRQELQGAIDYLQSLSAQGNVEMGELVDKQLAKLGNVENVASSLEGVVFEHPPGSGKIYKLTGAFAMANQIIGRARRSGMNEGIDGTFTVQVSATQSLTKSLTEWIREMKMAKHQVGTVPAMVYGDILNGVPIVDIVRAEDAQEVIYNTVHAYAAKVLQERLEPVLEIIEDEIEDTIEIEDEDDDPVGPGPQDRTVAIVPGAFKPPHLGHADMVRKYAAMADEVIVLISKPLQSVRSLPNGRVITAEDSLKIWELLTKDIPNVTIGVYNDPAVRSPMSAGYALVGKPGEREVAATKVEPPIEAIAPGNKVILGASRKGGDWKRWQGAEKYVGEDLDLLDPAQTAVKPLVRSEDAAFSATDMRELLGDPLNNTQELEEYIGPGNVPELLSILGLSEEPLEEMSGMAGGAVGGFSAPFGRSSAVKRRFKKKKRRKKRKKKKNESVDLTIVDEIFKLLIERGIIT